MRIVINVVLLSICSADMAVSQVRAEQMSFLDNGTIRIGVDLDIGGTITFLARSNGGENLINSHDLGRQVQQSYYSGPHPFGKAHPGLEELAAGTRSARETSTTTPAGSSSIPTTARPVRQDDPDAMGPRTTSPASAPSRPGSRWRATPRRCETGSTTPVGPDSVPRSRPGVAGGLHDRQALPAVHLRRATGRSRANP